MKIGDRVSWVASGGRTGGQVDRSGEVVAKIKPGESAKGVFAKKVKDKTSLFKISPAQETSTHERVIVKAGADPVFYLAPRVSKLKLES